MSETVNRTTIDKRREELSELVAQLLSRAEQLAAEQQEIESHLIALNGAIQVLDELLQSSTDTPTDAA